MNSYTGQSASTAPQFRLLTNVAGAHARLRQGIGSRPANGAPMDALDLTKQPPRSPRAPLGSLDLLMAARTVDKLRAMLPGGNMGDYQITGFSSSLLNRLGIAEHQLRDTVARAASDAEIADWIAAHSDPSKYPEINAALAGPTIGERLNDAAFVERYPVVRELPPDTPRLDLLDADDAKAFPPSASS